MDDTRHQSMIEMNRQLEELRLQQTKQAEEQSAWNQELKEELKDLLREYFAAQFWLPSFDQNRKGYAKESSVLVAHQVLEEMPQSANTIEVVQIDESSEEGDVALFEIVGNIKRDEERPTNSDEKDKTARAQPTNDNDELTGKMLKADGDLEQDLAAHHVLEGMTRIIDESVVLDLEFESAPVSSVGELDDSRTFKVSDLKDATSLLLFKNKFTDLFSLLNEMPAQEEIRMNYREVLCFDPGGGFLDLAGDSFKLAIVPLESSNLWCDEELTKMTFSLSLEDDPCLLKCYMRLSHQWWWSAGFVPCLLKCLLSNCVVGLATFRHGFPSDCSSGEWIMQSQIIGCLARLIFDPGGQCSRFTETESFVSCLLWLCNQRYKLIIKSSSQEQYFCCLILRDKDLKEGVL